MQDNFNIHEWRLSKAINELNEKKLCNECGTGYMEEGQCMECGYMEEATFTDKHDDNPKLKGGQKDLPDELQAGIIKKEGLSKEEIKRKCTRIAKTKYEGRFPSVKATQDIMDCMAGKIWAKEIERLKEGIIKKEGIEWPKKISSRYSDEYTFIHNDNKPGYYDIKDLATGEIIGRAGFTSPEKAEYFAKDTVKPKGGTISTQLEGEDHEVSMAQNSLKSIISSASQLMNKLGNDERNIPGWIQDHITNAENYIDQANQGYHEL